MVKCGLLKTVFNWHLAFLLPFMGRCPFVLKVEDSHLLNVSALLQPIIVALILKMLFFDEDLEAQFLSTAFCYLEDVAEKAYRGLTAAFCLSNVIFRCVFILNF